MVPRVKLQQEAYCSESQSAESQNVKIQIATPIESQTAESQSAESQNARESNCERQSARVKMRESSVATPFFSIYNKRYDRYVCIFKLQKKYWTRIRY